jgi:Cof subfamily protein (haloacid dehalogenase superfamily)
LDIKILFSDLDGTLVSHAGDVKKDTIEACHALIKNHISLVLVTGRHPDMTRRIHHKIGLDTPVIGCNGGLIKDLTTNEILYINAFSKAHVEQTISIANRFHIDWVVYEKNHIFFDKMPPKSYQLPYINSRLPISLRANFVHVRSLDEMFTPDRVFIKTLLLCDRNPEAMEACMNELEGLSDTEVLRSANTYLDVMAKGSSKGKAISRYLDMIKLDREHIAAIGDAPNDLDMISYAQLGIAMGNAMPIVKEAAQFITSPHPTGFADAVKFLLDGSLKG